MKKYSLGKTGIRVTEMCFGALQCLKDYKAKGVIRAIGISTHAVGMVNQEELELNLKIFNDEEIPQEFLSKKIKPSKRLFISRFCKGCGTCVKTCPNNALSLENGKAVVDHKLCILCGYCNPVCPEFAIRLI